jgi:periplasmic protein TonB
LQEFKKLTDEKPHPFTGVSPDFSLSVYAQKKMTKQDSLDLIENPPQVIVPLEADPADTAEEVLSFAEEMPSFKNGGEKAFQEYLKANLRYPTAPADTGISGAVYIYFEVNKDGSIGFVKCQFGIKGHPAFCEEAMRVIQEMPKWNPGVNDGKPVKVGMTVPVRFGKP